MPKSRRLPRADPGVYGLSGRNTRTNTFSLGMNVLRLGFEYIASLDVAQVGQPVIEQLRDVSQCSSHLAIRDGRDIIYIARVSAAGSRINQVSIGTHVCRCTAPRLAACCLTDISRADFEQLFRRSACRATHRVSFTTVKPCGRWCSRINPRIRGIGESFPPRYLLHRLSGV